jgi:hypothetical protein
MLPIPAPVPYALPYVLRKNRRSFIVFFAIILLLCIAPWLYFAASTDPAGDPVTWIGCFLFVAFFGLLLLGSVSGKIILTEDRISSREWFFWKEMEYARITAVRFYYKDAGEGGTVPMLELSGDTGKKITINLGMYASPANLWVIYDVLKKKAVLAGIHQSPDEFFTVPGETSWGKNALLEPYTLPLILRIDRVSSIIVSVLFLPLIAAIFYFGVFLSPPANLATRVFFLLITGFFLLGYLAFVMPAIRLTEDRISLRTWFFWKELEYTRITVVRFYCRNSYPGWDSEPVLELSGDTGDRITLSFGILISADHLPVIYDVLKKRAPQAGLGKSAEEFFTHPDAIAG